MIKCIFIIFISLSLGMDKLNDNVYNQVQRTVQVTEGERKAKNAVKKLKKSTKSKIVPSRNSTQLQGPGIEGRGIKYVGNINRDYIIYNLERTDRELRTLNRSIDDLYEISSILETRENQVTETFEAFLLQYKEQQIKNARYDHFFMRLDETKAFMKNSLTLGTGSIGTAAIGFLTWWWRKKRKIKKPQS